MLLTLQQVGVVFAISAPHGELSGALLRYDHVESGQNVMNTDHRLAALIGSGYGNIEISYSHELRRDVL